VSALRDFARDPDLAVTTLGEDDRRRTAWDYQDVLWHLASGYVRAGGGDVVADPEEVSLILRHWREMLDGVRDDRAAVADRVDWVAKLRVLDGYRERYDLAPGDARLRAIDLQYHDLRAERSLAQRVGLVELFDIVAIREAVHNPPRTTRAYFRGQCVSRYPEQIVAANWDSVVFDLGQGPLQRVPMMDPLRGTAALTADLLETSPTADDLLEALDR
jgi:Pup amidohydrolase